MQHVIRNLTKCTLCMTVIIIHLFLAHSGKTVATMSQLILIRSVGKVHIRKYAQRQLGSNFPQVFLYVNSNPLPQQNCHIQYVQNIARNTSLVIPAINRQLSAIIDSCEILSSKMFFVPIAAISYLVISTAGSFAKSAKKWNN